MQSFKLWLVLSLFCAQALGMDRPYDKTRNQALSLLAEHSNNSETMPEIESARETLMDIYQQTTNTPIMQWIYKHAEFEKPQ